MLSITPQLPFSAKSHSPSAPPVKKASTREREYLRPSEIQAAKKVGRHRVRDAIALRAMVRTKV